MNRSAGESASSCAEHARSRRWGLSIAAPLLAIVLAFQADAAAAQDVPVRASADEAFVSLKYADVVDVVTSALVWRDSVYLPVVEIFRHLQIDAAFTADPLTVRGFYIHPERRYALDFAGGTARLVGTKAIELPIDRNEFLPDSNEVYVRPSLLERVFGLHARFDVSALTVRIESTRSDTLPSLRARLRSSVRPRPDLQPGERTPAALRYDRVRHRFNGGVVDYSTAGTITREGSALLSTIGVGTEVFGGDLVTALQLNAATVGSSLNLLDARWQYVTSDSARWLTAARMGALTSTGLRGIGIYGVQLTNAPLATRTRIGSQDVSGHTTPGWEVDLEVNGQLIARTRADAEGYYRFTIPLVYGTPMVTLRRYGPTGEVEVEQRRVTVPVTVLPEKTLEYTFSAGHMRDRDGMLSQLRAAYGVSGLLTAVAGYEYTTGQGSGFRPVLGAVARLPWSLAGSAEYAPGLLSRLQLDAMLGDQTSATLTLEQFPTRSLYNTLAVRRAVRLLGFAPIGVKDIPLTFRFGADVQTHLQGGGSFAINPELTLNLPAFKPRIGYQRSVFQRDGTSITLRDVASAGLTVFASNPPGPLRLIDGALLGATARYDLADGAMQAFDFELSRNLSRSGRIAVAMGRDFQARRGFFEARFVLDRASVQATTAISATGDNLAVTQHARGSLSFDPVARAIHTSNRDWVGRAGTVFRTFVDEDGDAVYDQGETLVTGAELRFRQSVAARSVAPGMLRTEDLLSYNRYSVDVHALNTPNPLWRPAFAEFSFITDPNAYKYIDIPFYVAGVVEGVAEQLVGASRRGIPGLAISIRNTAGDLVAELTTFNDGSWYMLGIAPGTYTASLERAQLTVLRLTTDALTVPFTIRSTPDGDIVSGINFELRPGVISTGH